MAVSRQLIVRMSNAVLRASQSFTLSEKRLLMLVLSKANEQDIKHPIHVSTAEYSKLYSVDSRSAHRTMVQAEEGLWEREFILDGYVKRWVTDKRIRPDGDWDVAIRIHEDLLPHISELTESYTQYFLRKARNFKSVYTWRLFELIMQFRSSGWLSISLADFSEALGYPESYRKDFGVVRQKVINPAIKAISEVGISVDMTVRKKGRSVHMLEFKFKTEQQNDWIKQSNAPTTAKVTKKYIEKHARPGESYEDARQRLERELKKSAQEVSQQQKTA